MTSRAPQRTRIEQIARVVQVRPEDRTPEQCALAATITLGEAAQVMSYRSVT